MHRLLSHLVLGLCYYLALHQNRALGKNSHGTTARSHGGVVGSEDLADGHADLGEFGAAARDVGASARFCVEIRYATRGTWKVDVRLPGSWKQAVDPESALREDWRGAVLARSSNRVAYNELLVAGSMELIHRQAKLVFMRRVEAKLYWEKSGIDCVMLRSACDAALDVVPLRGKDSRMHPVDDLVQCLSLGRQLLDPSRASDLDYLFHRKKPTTIVSPTSLDEGTVKNCQSFLHAFGRLVLVKSPDIKRGALDYQRTLLGELGFHVFEDASFLIALPVPRLTRRKSAIKEAFAISKLDAQHKWVRVKKRFAPIVRKGLVPQLKRLVAVDGKNQRLTTAATKDLFQIKSGSLLNPYEDHGFRPGIIGCALSHLILWRKLVEDPSIADVDAYLVLEDDAFPSQDLAPRWERFIQRAAFEDTRWDLMFLGFIHDAHSPFVTPWRQVHDSILKFDAVPRSSGGGMHGYLIRKSGARKLFEAALRAGIGQAIDWFVVDNFASGNIAAYLARPLLIVPDDLETSSTYQEYPFGSHRDLCVPAGNQASQPGSIAIPQIQDVVLKVLGPAMPDLPVESTIVLSSDANLTRFQHDHRCLRLCYRVGLPVGGEMRQADGCFFALEHNEGQVELIAWPLLQRHDGGSVEVHFAGFDKFSRPVRNAVPAPILVAGHQSLWPKLVLRSVGTSDVHVSVIVPHGQKAEYLKREASSLVCVSGKCLHIGGLPDSILPFEDFNEDELGQRCSVERRFFLGMKDVLGRDIVKCPGNVSEHFSDAGSFHIDVHESADLGALPTVYSYTCA